MYLYAGIYVNHDALHVCIIMDGGNSDSDTHWTEESVPTSELFLILGNCIYNVCLGQSNCVLLIAVSSFHGVLIRGVPPCTCRQKAISTTVNCSILTVRSLVWTPEPGLRGVLPTEGVRPLSATCPPAFGK